MRWGRAGPARARARERSKEWLAAGTQGSTEQGAHKDLIS